MKTMNHAQYQKQLRTKSVEALRFIANDAREAVDANPYGENVGYYLDEISYCGMELNRRGIKNHWGSSAAKVAA